MLMAVRSIARLVFPAMAAVRTTSKAHHDEEQTDKQDDRKHVAHSSHRLPCDVSPCARLDPVIPALLCRLAYRLLWLSAD